MPLAPRLSSAALQPSWNMGYQGHGMGPAQPWRAPGGTEVGHVHSREELSLPESHTGTLPCPALPKAGDGGTAGSLYGSWQHLLAWGLFG